MADFLRALGENKLARSLIKRTGVPLPVPPRLARAETSWTHATLSGRRYIVGGSQTDSHDFKSLLLSLRSAEAGVVAPAFENFDPEISSKLDLRVDGLVFDGRRITSSQQLDELHLFFYQNLARVRSGSRSLVIGLQPQSTEDPLQSGLQEALTGVVRSLAKELGTRGSSVNLVMCHEAASLSGALRYFLSDHASFVTGQVITAGFAVDETQRFESILSDRTVLITGAARGIGAAIARAAAREGGRLLLLDHPTSAAALHEFAREISASAVTVDLCEASSAEVVLKKLWEHGPIHGVIHNAGVTRDKTLARMSREQWRTVQRVNFEFPIELTNLLLAREQGDLLAKDAAFVFLSSIGGIAGNAGQTNYAASKAGLIGYVKGQAARQIIESTPGLKRRFNAVAPGFIETPMTAAMPFALREFARRFNAFKQGGLPEDVAAAVNFLVSPAGAEFSGQTLRVCGQNLIGA